MPYPAEYQRATDQFSAYLAELRDVADLASSHSAYTTTQGVFRCFRRRIALADAIRFADTLPVGLRALFVADWDPEETRRPFSERGVMLAEVRALRSEHNFAPETAIEDVAVVVRRHADLPAFERVIATIGTDAGAFWAPRRG